MHCPNCGIVALRGQKFCRACGFGLEKVEQLIAERATGENIESASDSSKERSTGSLHWFSFFIIIFLTFSVYLVAGGTVGVFGVICFIALLLILLALGTHMEFGRVRLNQQESSQPASAINAPTTKKLTPGPGLEMNASATEKTTASLAEKIES
ncbi:MAG TPA: hypothetical protein VJ810_16735 [Blastocatellia bacterium]|nr:hypothetical protein [Blastocatellia bacterium]